MAHARPFIVVDSAGVRRVCKNVNALTLGAYTGLTVSAGRLVCDATVDVENLHDGVCQLDATAVPCEVNVQDMFNRDENPLALPWIYYLQSGTNAPYCTFGVGGGLKHLRDATTIQQCLMLHTTPQCYGGVMALILFFLTSYNNGGASQRHLGDQRLAVVRASSPYHDYEYYAGGVEYLGGYDWKPVLYRKKAGGVLTLIDSGDSFDAKDAGVLNPAVRADGNGPVSLWYGSITMFGEEQPYGASKTFDDSVAPIGEANIYTGIMHKLVTDPDPVFEKISGGGYHAASES